MMFASLNDISADEFFDYCVIGSGPAGLTCAASLADSGKRILVLEGGDRTYSERSQALYQGSVIGDKYFDLSLARLRYFGGSSNHWSGWCRPLDPYDFEPRSVSPAPRWPIRRADLDPYLARASAILEIGPLPEDVRLPNSQFKSISFAMSRPPVRFGDKYLKLLEHSPNILVALQANVVSLSTDGSSITAAEVVDFGGNQHSVRAEQYVLAAGGIENSRLLMWSNELSNGRVVQHAKCLGRYWMEHPHFTIGFAILRRSDALDVRSGPKYFALTESAMRNEGVLNGSLRVYPEKYSGAKKAIADLACVAPELSRSASELLGKNLVCGATIRSAWEQAPRYNNRIELSQERDRLGVPRPILYWKKDEGDRHTVQTLVRRFGEYLAQTDLGRLRLDPWVLGDEPYPEDDELAGHHHMGGTRMAEAPRDGVVDRDCRVFGQRNLFIAGSSVFPSCGHANPTLTIVQMALRLADHLRAL